MEAQAETATRDSLEYVEETNADLAYEWKRFKANAVSVWGATDRKEDEFWRFENRVATALSRYMREQDGKVFKGRIVSADYWVYVWCRVIWAVTSTYTFPCLATRALTDDFQNPSLRMTASRSRAWSSGPTWRRRWMRIRTLR